MHDYRLIFVGPAIHYFLIWMDKVVPRSEKYSNLKRIILDRLIFAPPFLLIYFYLVAIFEVRSHRIVLVLAAVKAVADFHINFIYRQLIYNFVLIFVTCVIYC